MGTQRGEHILFFIISIINKNVNSGDINNHLLTVRAEKDSIDKNYLNKMKIFY